ncbi:MAG: iron-sulfur cluster repair protein YtfE [Planctomycetes bacterium]|nr:iron-sulfur cluster repair protein YtfE [Planctomycetota bacterium]
MTPYSAVISPDRTLADLATAHASASRVFHRHGLDFCCHGRVRLDEACRDRGLDLDALLSELQTELDRAPEGPRLDQMPIPMLIEHVLEQYHAAHRAELPRLLEMARKVEKVHGDKSSCPRGLAAHLEFVAGELEAHMQKEEQVLFPLFTSSRRQMAGMPVQVMEMEHEDHGRNLARLRELAHGYQPPAEACNTWRALYLGLEQLERDVMQHIHIENNILFPRALRE